MKWPILFLLFSCGQYKEPLAKDYGDSDGDRFLNYQEDQNFAQKYIADITPPKGLKATISFMSGSQSLKEVKIKLTNDIDLISHSKELLTFNEKAIKKDPYFSEMSRLSIENSPSSDKYEAREFYDFRLSFHDVQERPDSVYLVTSEEEIPIGKWDYDMELRFGHNDFQKLLSGKLHLAISGQKMVNRESIRNKTYRVFMNDGKKAKVLYVSNELDFRKLLNYLKLSPQPINDFDILTFPYTGLKAKWWSRKLGADWVVVYADIDDLKKSLLTGFARRTVVLNRIEGKAKDKVLLKKHDEARVIFKLRPADVVIKEFEFKRGVTYAGGRGQAPVCYYESRYIKKEVRTKTGLRPITDSFDLKINGRQVPLQINKNMFIYESKDQAGPFWTVIIYTDARDLEISLKDLPKQTYVQTGKILTGKCGRTTTQLVNKESKMVLKVETLVEKIQ